MDDLPSGTLDDCDCRGEGGNSGGDFEKITVPKERPSAPGPLKMPEGTYVRPRKPRSKGTGSFCVVSHKGNVVHCYADSGVAKRVAESFGSRTGTKFTVKKR